jgi:hypothetical protein
MAIPTPLEDWEMQCPPATLEESVRRLSDALVMLIEVVESINQGQRVLIEQVAMLKKGQSTDVEYCQDCGREGYGMELRPCSLHDKVGE